MLVSRIERVYAPRSDPRPGRTELSLALFVYERREDYEMCSRIARTIRRPIVQIMKAYSAVSAIDK